MSWDVFIQHLPASALNVDDIPDDFAPLPLGSREEVLLAIARAFPGADASDPTWVTFACDQYAVDFGVGADDPVSCVALHVRGSETVVPAIVRLIDELHARALDSWTGEIFDEATARESIRRWRAFVDESS